jgi:hypothetical protein
MNLEIIVAILTPIMIIGFFLVSILKDKKN